MQNSEILLLDENHAMVDHEVLAKIVIHKEWWKRHIRRSVDVGHYHLLNFVSAEDYALKACTLSCSAEWDTIYLKDVEHDGKCGYCALLDCGFQRASKKYSVSP